MEARLLVLLAALGIDRVVGDPDALWRRLPHPVVLFGAAVGLAERRLNDPALAEGPAVARGALAIGLLLALAAAVGGAATAIAEALPLGEALLAVLVAVLLAHRSLLEHVRAVADALGTEGLAGGRRAVAMIVGRDPAALDEAGVARAAIESAAENLSDGVVAPAFWFALLGLPGLFAYKMLNTADSMIGHRDARHRFFGRATARLDDLANLVPARLTTLLLALAAGGGPGRWLAILRVAVRDAPRHASPNAGWPETAMAAALGIALGGPRRYGSLAVEGAWLNGAGRRSAGPPDIARALALVDRAGAIQAGLYALSLLALVLS